MLHVYAHTRPVRGEDRYTWFWSDSGDLVICIADGHGGSTAAETCIGNVAAVYAQHPSSPTHIFAALHDLCLKLPCCSGCTFTMLVVTPATGVIRCANVGDSHAYCVSSTSFRQLTESHRLQDNAAERMRHCRVIHRAQTGGPPRMYPGGLACSRSLGDADCEHISPIPFECDDVLGENEDIVVCSDGVTDVVDPRRMVAKQAYHNPLCFVSPKSTDDATAIVVTRSTRRSLGLFGRTGSWSSSDDDTPPATVMRVCM